MQELNLRDDDEYYAEFSIDSLHYKRYSVKALGLIKSRLADLDVDEIWARRKPRPRRPK